jgi:phosphoribosylformylglycinamidine cyclo-ligase
MLCRALKEFHSGIHSLVHCTGGGQVKIKRFGQQVRFEKDNLFETPPLFSLIQEHGKIPWAEMYSVFNMGHRLEACVEPAIGSELIDIAAQFGIAARIVGRVSSASGDNEVIISSTHGEFRY